MSKYRIKYVSAPDDIFIKSVEVEAVNKTMARVEVKDTRDVYQIISIVEIG